MSEHPELAVLAELQADAVEPGADAAALRTHVAGCARCQAEQARLADVHHRLTDLPAPPMPDEVASRVRDALAAEAPQPAHRGDGHDHVAGTPRPPIRERRWWPKPGLVAASVVLLLLLGIGASVLAHRSGPSGNSSTADHSSRVTSSPPAQSSGGTLLAASGRDYSPGTLDGDVRRLLAGQVASPTSTTRPRPDAVTPDRTGGSGAADPLARLRQPAALAACVRTLTGGRPADPLAVDYASYQGRPAVVVVLPGPHAQTVVVYVAPATCGPHHPDFLYYHQTSR